MSAMKEKFMELQEKTYKKLENMGAPKETIFKFSEMLSDYKFEDFVEKMAGYTMTIGSNRDSSISSSVSSSQFLT